MSYFYGTLRGNRGQATRCGSKKGGMETYCASWKGAVRCSAYVNKDGEDWVRVEFTGWQGSGNTGLLYDGPIAGPMPKAKGPLEKTWMVDAEAVHNWVNRKDEWEHYYGDLPVLPLLAIDEAHAAHHKDGRNAQELAEELVGRFPCLKLRGAS